jgi:thymidylate synthase (FAD)
MTNTFNNINYNKVKLVGYTIPHPEYFKNSEVNSITDLIAFCARVSNPSNQLNQGTADKLISYLLSHKHFSPFEMCNAVLEIETTRDIARQILRHRSFSFQEFSQRYADPTQVLPLVTREARLQDIKNRQNSVETSDADLHINWENLQKDVSKVSLNAYEWAVKNGIAKEVARSVLPEGNMVSRLYMNGTIRSWIHYLEVRTGNGTQKEHIDIAQKCALALSEIFPLINRI